MVPCYIAPGLMFESSAIFEVWPLSLIIPNYNDFFGGENSEISPLPTLQARLRQTYYCSSEEKQEESGEASKYREIFVQSYRHCDIFKLSWILRECPNYCCLNTHSTERIHCDYRTTGVE